MGTAEINNGAIQKVGEHGTLLRGEAGNNLFFQRLNGRENLLMAGMAFWKQIDPPQPVVCGIRQGVEKPLFFQPAQSAGYTGVTQLKMLFQVPAAGGS